jgi:hypothetical protein
MFRFVRDMHTNTPPRSQPLIHWFPSCTLVTEILQDAVLRCGET